MNRHWQDYLAAKAGLEAEPFPGQTVVELLGDRRVLIEPHRGVLAYDRECIRVGLQKGQAEITGEKLQLAKMDRHRILITGRIQGIQLTEERIG